MNHPELPLTLQTSYAELIDQLQLAELSSWPTGSTFRKRTISGQAYWYVQEPTRAGTRPAERYIGKSNPETDARIETARSSKSAADGRRLIVRSLLAAGLVPPDRLAGDILAELAQLGLFRLRGILVGTQAYQAYPALLGVRLPATAIQTGDLDIAQDFGISVALNDQLEIDLLEALKHVDKTFRAVPNAFSNTASSSYVARSQFRVDVLTTNRGSEQRDLPHLPSLRSEATPLRFLDFLLRDPIPAAVLHKSGILVNVPTPQRYAVHKLIVATERGADNPKSPKDILQAETLILALAQKRRVDDVVETCLEAVERGTGWRERLSKSAKRLSREVQDVLQPAKL